MSKIISMCNIDIVREYMGNGWLVLLFLAAFIYLIFTEKKKQFRVILVWATAVMMLLFLFPLTRVVFGKATNEATYYRFLWMIPMGITIAYASARLFLNHRIMGIIVTASVIMLAGEYVYTGQYMYPAENVYHLPQEMIEICDQIHPEKFDTVACFPTQYIHQVRQYDSSIVLAFSREELVGAWTLGNEIYDLSIQECLDVEALTKACREKQVEYYIVSKFVQTTGQFEEYGWDLYYESEHYYVYRDVTIGSVWERVVDWLSEKTPQEREEWLDSQGITLEEYELQLQKNQEH